jgi:hypothetical protein
MWIRSDGGTWYNMASASSIDCADKKTVNAVIDGKDVLLKTLTPGEDAEEVLFKFGAAMADENGYYDAVEMKVMTPYRSPKK